MPTFLLAGSGKRGRKRKVQFGRIARFSLSRAEQTLSPVGLAKINLPPSWRIL